MAVDIQVGKTLPLLDEPYVTHRTWDEHGVPHVTTELLRASEEEKRQALRAAYDVELARCERFLELTRSGARFGPEEWRRLTPELHKLLIDDAQAAVDAVRAAIAEHDGGSAKREKRGR